MKRIAMMGITDETVLRAKQLANEFGYPYTTVISKSYDYVLQITPQFIGLKSTFDPESKPFYIDFSSPVWRYRLQKASLRRELLGKAIGFKPQTERSIVDVTAGFGRDAFILAALGFHLVLLERHPIVYLMLNDALQRAAALPLLNPITNRLKIFHADAQEWLTHHHPFHVIYLDPMFPLRTKSAAVKKTMRIMQDIVGFAANDAGLLPLALACATSRVVVKRPRLATYMNDQPPHFSLKGKSTRFDVYLVKS